ncbi:cupin domain-containing protein [Simkania negevensis]|uniref:cupin domain-containing protein n=1 Tax=Simkania negevensis TaxID=83561 RepID=UPI000310ADB1|nr:cupin domain-containing protein [Simkania negevensis]
MKKINLLGKFKLFDAHWTPKIIGEVNDSYVKLFKAKGEFVWHRHENEDEFFLVVKGQLHIKLKDEEVILNEGDMFIVPKGVDHMPYAPEEAYVLLFEPKEVLNTGNIISEQSVQKLEWI